MLIKQILTSSDEEKLNCFFKEMIDKTKSKHIKNLGIHNTYINFIYLMGDTQMMAGPLLELPMSIVLIENDQDTNFCMFEQYTHTHLDIQDTTKFEDFSNDVIFVRKDKHFHVGTIFDSFGELDLAIDRILNYTFLLVLDNVTNVTPFKH